MVVDSNSLELKLKHVEDCEVPELKLLWVAVGVFELLELLNKVPVPSDRDIVPEVTADNEGVGYDKLKLLLYEDDAL